MKWKVWVCLESEYDDIEAESAEAAFIIASDAAMSGGSWDYSAVPVDDDGNELERSEQG